MPDTTKLDEAIIAYRENDTDDNRDRLLAIQAEYVTACMEENTVDYIARTRG